MDSKQPEPTPVSPNLTYYEFVVEHYHTVLELRASERLDELHARWVKSKSESK